MNICDSDSCNCRTLDILILSWDSSIRQRCSNYEHTCLLSKKIYTQRLNLVSLLLWLSSLQFRINFLRVNICAFWELSSVCDSKTLQPNCSSKCTKDLRLWSGKILPTTQWTFTEIVSVDIGYSSDILWRPVSFTCAGNVAESTLTNFCLKGCAC
jgi:hypothetical protein